MRKGNFTSLVVLSTALVFPAFAEKVKMEQLTPALQEKIRAQTGSSEIEDIDRETRNGKTVYEVAFKRNGQNTEIRIEDTGESSTAASSPSTTLDSRKISYSELPVLVRRVADAQIKNKGGVVNDIDRQVKNGDVTYAIGFKQNDGPQQEIVLSQNGRVIRAPDSSTSLTAAPNSPLDSTAGSAMRTCRRASAGSLKPISDKAT